MGVNGRELPVLGGRGPSCELGLTAAHAELGGHSGSMATVCKLLTVPTLAPSSRFSACCTFLARLLCSIMGWMRVEARTADVPLPGRSKGCDAKLLDFVAGG